MRLRLDPALAALFRALRTVDGGQLMLLEPDSIPWASDTFEGARHRLGLRFEGPGGVERAGRLAAALPDMDFVLHGHLVAEVAEIEVLENELRCSILTVVDA